jgi:hypothetical protein
MYSGLQMFSGLFAPAWFSADFFWEAPQGISELWRNP